MTEDTNTRGEWKAIGPDGSPQPNSAVSDRQGRVPGTGGIIVLSGNVIPTYANESKTIGDLIKDRKIPQALMAQLVMRAGRGQPLNDERLTGQDQTAINIMARVLVAEGARSNVAVSNVGMLLALIVKGPLTFQQAFTGWQGVGGLEKGGGVFPPSMVDAVGAMRNQDIRLQGTSADKRAAGTTNRSVIAQSLYARQRDLLDRFTTAFSINLTAPNGLAQLRQKVDEVNKQFWG